MPEKLPKETEIRFGSSMLDIAAPPPETIWKERRAMATAAVRMNRFGGLSRVPYTVAQHSQHVQRLAMIAGARRDIIDGCLIHDLAECCGISDIPSPIKRLLRPAIDDIENRLLDAIEIAFGLPQGISRHADVKKFDRIAFEIEYHDLWKHPDDSDLFNGYATPEIEAERFLSDLEKVRKGRVAA